MYQKQFNTRERADFLKDFDLNKDGYVTMKEIKQRIQEKKADLFKDLDVDGDGNIAIKEMITKLNPTSLEKKIYEKNGPARRRHYGYLDSTLASKNKERNVTAQLSAPGFEGGSPGLQGRNHNSNKFYQPTKRSRPDRNKNLSYNYNNKFQQS